MTMSFGGSSYNRFQDEKYLFIDGAYLREVVRSICEKYYSEGVDYQLDYSKLAAGFRKTFYYDCLPGRNQGEADEEYRQRILPQTELFNALKKISGFHVYEGVVKGEKRGRQKMVDIMIAVDMLNHTIRGNMAQVSFVGGDLDFKPLIDALVQNGMFVTLLYEKETTSDELICSSDSSSPITIQTLHGWASPKFQRENTLPRSVSTTSDETKNYTFVKKGLTSSGDLVELHKKIAKYCISYSSQHNYGYKIFVKHGDLEFLEKYVQDVCCSYTWDK